SGAAYSADLDNILYGAQPPTTKPVEIGNGWYLRGDVGYNFSTDGDVSSIRTFDTATSTYDSVPYSSHDFDSNMTWGLGVGYQLNNWFRVEGLGTVTTGSFEGRSSTATGSCAGLTIVGCSTTGDVDYTAWGLMANGYIDIGTYSGFTPYVGAGLGATLVDYGTYRATQTPTGNPSFRTSSEGYEDWRFTYALMAGVAYEFARNWKVDVGYKYTNIDGGDMYRFDETSRGNGARGVQVSDDGIEMHQILASLRYSLW
ncbi:MAG: OmpW family outer membrane protein, partial [Pseudomonadota bacterium]